VLEHGFKKKKAGIFLEKTPIGEIPDVEMEE